MILVSIGLSIIIGIFVKAYFLPIVLRLVVIRSWMYGMFASEEGRAHGEEMQANLPDEIALYRLGGDSNDVIAAKILFRLVAGLPCDLAIWTPSIPAMLVGKIAGWSNGLRHYRIPAALVAGVATLGLMNYSFFSSSDGQSFITWLFANTIGIAMTVLLWKHKHPLARRIFQVWMGIAMTGGVAVMAWMVIRYHLYDNMTFKILMLSMTALLPAIIVIDTSWRNRLFRGRWWLVAICWALIIAGAFIGSLLIAHSINPLFEMWAAIGLLAVGFVMVYGTLALVAFALCWAGIRGSASGLRLVATGIRRLH